MANFTTSEINAFTIATMKKQMKGDIFIKWVFGIKDANDNYIQWDNTSLVENASKTEIKTAIKSYLAEVEKPSVPLISRYVDVIDKGKGETVG